MNERRHEGSTRKGKSDDSGRTRPVINFKNPFLMKVLTINDKGKNTNSKPSDGTIELDQDFNKDQKRVVVIKSDERVSKLDSILPSSSHRTLDSNNHVQGSNSRKPNFKKPKIESYSNSRPLNNSTKRSNFHYNKNSSTTRSDESLNIDASSKYYERGSNTYNTRDLSAKEAYNSRKYEKSARDFSNSRPFSNKFREVSRSDESLNQNFTQKKEFQPKSRLNNSKNVPENEIPSVKPCGKINGLPISRTNNLYDKKQQTFSTGNKTHSSRYSNSETSKPHYGKRDLNHNVKENQSAPYNRGKYSYPHQEYSKSTSSYEKDSIPKENYPLDDIPCKTIVSDTINKQEKSIKDDKNISNNTPFYDHNREDKNRLPTSYEENYVQQANAPNNSLFDGYRSDDGSTCVSDEPDGCSYIPRKQRLKNEKKPKDKKVDFESELQAITPPFNADNEFSIDPTICPIPPPHDVDTFLTIVKDDDADSISSENLEPMENYDLPASDEKQDKLEDSENSDVSIDPAVIKSVANYLEKLEKEELKNLTDPNKVVREVNNILNYKCNGNQVSLYGSHLSGLAVELSNINLVLKSNQPEKNSVLLMLQRHLSKGLYDYEVEPFEEETSVRKSKICFYTRSSVQCLIMYDMKPVSDYCKTSLLLKRVHEFDPRVKTLIIAARKWVEACLMNENGNNVVLHPVGLALLVVHFLQHTKPAVLPIIDTSAEDLGLKSLDVKNNSGVGELWFKFLQFYTKMFDWETDVVTIQHKEVLLKSDINWEHFSVAIQEPYSRKNVTGSFTSYEFIHTCFKVYYEHLVMGINSSDSETDENSSDCSEVGKYSFFDTRIKCPLPVFCEECAELEDEFCEKCQNEKSVVSRVLEKLPELTDHSMKCIDKALLHVYNTVSLTVPEMKGRQAFVEDLEEYIQIRFPDAQLKLFGSSVNMFGLKKSDLDICMTLKHRINDNIEAKNFLQRIVSHLRKRPREYSGVLPLFSAKVPIVKFYAVEGGFLCDLSLYNVLSVNNSKLLSKYAMIDERCRIIGCALKYLTMKGWISDSSSKFLSSYSYVLMVIHYLQQTNPPVLPVMSLEDKEVFINNIDIPDRVTTNKNYWYYETPEELRKRYKVFPRNESSTAELWLGFLEYYLKFDRSFAVTITQKEPMPASELSKSARLFNIEDPFEYKRNLGGVLSEENADKTLAVFLKARSLFGKNVPTETHENVHNHYFSTNNLLGRVGKEMECNFCGAFDHDSEDCLKKNPFKKSAIRNSHPATRPGRRRN